MKILIIGGGGREHAIAYKCSLSNLSTEIFVSPGNPGTAQEKKTKNVNLQNKDDVLKFCKEKKINLCIIGPELPLSEGYVDFLSQNNIKTFGPTKKASQLETSKTFAKEFMFRNNIPTGKFKKFNNKNDALNYINNAPLPHVIKYDGLASGKGVVVSHNLEESKKTIINFAEKYSPNIIIEEYLDGTEASFIVGINQSNYVNFCTSQDHKQLYDNDQGPNTGGMGAFAPVKNITPDIESKIIKKIIEPTITGLKNEAINYCGFLYVGLMIDSNGNPKVLEFNCRLGDPEAQPILMKLDDDLAQIILDLLDNKKVQLTWSKKIAMTVVLASKGYPDNPETGIPITIPSEIIEDQELKVFHSGTKLIDNKLYSHGGRVLNVSSLGESIDDCRKKIYDAIAKIKFEACCYRKDIGLRKFKF